MTTKFTESLTHRSLNRAPLVHGTAHTSFSGGREGKGREGRKGGSVCLHLTTEPRETDGVDKINLVASYG